MCCIRFGGGALPNGACEAEATCTGAGTSKGCGGAGADDCASGEVCCNDPAFGLSSDFCWPGACPLADMFPAATARISTALRRQGRRNQRALAAAAAARAIDGEHHGEN